MDDAQVDPDAVATRTELGEQLSRLRQASGFTVRELAGRLDIPRATLGGYFAGRHLPSASQLMTFTALLAECGVRDPDEQRRWILALTRARTSSDGRAARGVAPYLGLQPYTAESAEWFFGREALTRLLAERVQALRSDGGIVPVVGASGSGKSSLVRAGLVPTLGGRASVLTPGARPLDALAGVDDDLDLLVVDQCEELFTLCDDTAVRTEFLQRLDGLPAPVVITLRADFYPDAMAEETLVAALEQQVLVTPMRPDELRAAIVEPARRAGLRVEPALVDTVLADLRPAGVRDRAHAAGSLPLMSHALLATWTLARRKELTLADYRAAGGIEGAVQKSADDLHEQLHPDDQLLSRRLFRRLAQLGDGAVLTRRPMRRAELDASTGLAGLVTAYTGARLLTATQDEIQISHEALLTAWPRLHDWIDTDREGLRQHRQLTEAANTWQRNDRDPALFMTGTPLATARQWATDDDGADELNDSERTFLDASVAADQARSDARRRRTRRLRQLLGAVAALAVAALVLAVVAVRAGISAERERRSATEARDAALSRQVAGEATDLESKDPTLAAELANAAYSISRTEEARSALLASTGRTVATRWPESTSPLQSVAAAGPAFAVGGADGLVRVWPRRTQGRRATIVHPARPGAIFATALSPDGRLLAAGGAAKDVDVWSVDGTRHVATLTGFTNTVYAIAFSPSGRVLAAGSADGTVRRWSLASSGPRELAALPKQKAYVQSLAFDRTGDRLAFGTADGTIVLCDNASGPTATVQARVHVKGAPAVIAAAFAPDADLMATGDTGDMLRLWRVPPHGRPAQLHAVHDGDSWVNSVAFDPDGSRVLSANTDGSVHGYSVADASVLLDYAHPAPVTAAAFDPALHRVITTSNDGMLRLWPWTDRSLYGAGGPVFSLSEARSGLLAVGSADGTIALWRGEQRSSAAIRSPVPGDALDGAAALSPDGHLVAAGTGGGRVGLWDVSTPATPRPLGMLPVPRRADGRRSKGWRSTRRRGCWRRAVTTARCACGPCRSARRAARDGARLGAQLRVSGRVHSRRPVSRGGERRHPRVRVAAGIWAPGRPAVRHRRHGEPCLLGGILTDVGSAGGRRQRPPGAALPAARRQPAHADRTGAGRPDRRGLRRSVRAARRRHRRRLAGGRDLRVVTDRHDAGAPGDGRRRLHRRVQPGRIAAVRSGQRQARAPLAGRSGDGRQQDLRGNRRAPQSQRVAPRGRGPHLPLDLLISIRGTTGPSEMRYPLFRIELGWPAPVVAGCPRQRAVGVRGSGRSYGIRRRRWANHYARIRSTHNLPLALRRTTAGAPGNDAICARSRTAMLREAAASLPSITSAAGLSSLTSAARLSCTQQTTRLLGRSARTHIEWALKAAHSCHKSYSQKY